MSCGLVVVGVSLGGLQALEILVSGLSADFSAPIAIVQHRRSNTGDLLAQILRQHSRLWIGEPQDKDLIEAGRIYLAPSDYHLLIDGGAFALTTEAPVSYARPSIDVLFESAADAYGAQTVGVVLTGANQDGARGAARIKERGGTLIVQTPTTAECAVMPQAAIDATQADHIVPLPQIAPLLMRLCHATGVDQ
jgi:two-component system, chemotaxis family, protein-glutamate methylesterase/glutaminase